MKRASSYDCKEPCLTVGVRDEMFIEYYIANLDTCQLLFVGFEQENVNSRFQLC